MSYRYASLTPDDEAAIVLHLLLLGDEDRALRFGARAADATLVGYARGLNFNRDVVEGVWDGGRLIGLAHLAVHPEDGYPVGELGLSVSEGYRGHQLGSRLVQRALARARRYRLTRMYVHYMRRNLAMARLMRRFGGRVDYDGDEARACVEVLPRDHSVRTEIHRGGPDGRLEIFKHLPRQPARGDVLLVHGAGGDGWQWRGLMAEIAARGYRAHALSLSGHGASAAAAPSLARYAEDLASVLADLPAATRLVGHSMGGYLVQRELARADRPAAVLLAPVPPEVPRDQDLASLLAGLAGQRTREVVERVLGDAEAVSAERIATPVSLISGDRDRVMPVPWMRATARRYRAPWTRLAAGHNLPLAAGIAGPLCAGLRL
ncbi:hypothetical protein dqs_3134 [Azoarcus olearius]|uniref:alpha/beta fold hydrolase n=1 Tax=Azoarcus sp. (strain BH72) TaxID=418699 RepID=UPI0008063561|nr:alpha/beta fold hydrolase [Azoarcus olearius]ANQ86162.1 hypothetical protein dqs_3134 [Azoarcus olearius]